MASKVTNDNGGSEERPYRTFGRLLGRIRSERGMTREDLAAILMISRSAVASWELGKTVPDRATILRVLGDALQLTFDEAVSLLMRAGYDELTMAELMSLEPASHPTEGSVLWKYHTPREVHVPPGDPAFLSNWNQQVADPKAMRELRVQIQDMQNTIEALTSRIEDTSISGGDDESPSVTDEIQSLKETLSHVQETSQELTVPLRFPRREDMVVPMVPSMWFQQLEDYRADQNRWYTATGVAGGALLGVAVNLVTGGQMTPSAFIFVVAFALMALWCGWSAITYQKRAKQLRNQTLAQAHHPWKPTAGAVGEERGSDSDKGKRDGHTVQR
jgi:transcriptional regulator with XRE-family HTH domain